MPRDQEEQDEHLRLLLPLFREHLPQKLVDEAFDRVPTTLPPQYLRNAMASCLACRVVYKEGKHRSVCFGDEGEMGGNMLLASRHAIIVHEYTFREGGGWKRF